MTRKVYPIIIALVTISALSFGDVFTNRLTGEKLYGYAEQKTMNGKMRIFVEKDGNFDSEIVNIAEYQVEYSVKGRRDTVIVLSMNQKESLISKVVADNIAKTIVEAADRGPIAVILEIDSPGGRGEYMSIITKAITDTTNCPVIAYITGDEYGGAFSAATAVALACEKIYISPNAIIGSSAPAHGALTARIGFDDYVKTYLPDNMSSYAPYAAKLAEQNNRPAVLAAALVDKSIEVLEVSSNVKGTKEFINSIDKIPSQQVVKRWTQRLSTVGTSDDNSPFGNPGFGNPGFGNPGFGVPSSQSMDVSNTLTLSAEDAVYCGIADKIVLTQDEILADIKAGEPRIIKNTSADSVSRMFVKNQRTIERLLSSITQREEISQKIESQLSDVITRQNNSIDITVVGRNENTNYAGQSAGNISNFDNNIVSNFIYSSDERKEMRRRQRELEEAQKQQQQSGYQQQQQVNPDDLTRMRLLSDLSSVLNDLASDYKQIIAIGKKYPGTIPAEISVSVMEGKLTQVRMKLRTL